MGALHTGHDAKAGVGTQLHWTKMTSEAGTDSETRTQRDCVDRGPQASRVDDVVRIVDEKTILVTGCAYVDSHTSRTRGPPQLTTPRRDIGGLHQLTLDHHRSYVGNAV